MSSRENPKSLLYVYDDTSRALEDSFLRIQKQIRAVLGPKVEFWVYHPGGDDLAIFLKSPLDVSQNEKIYHLIQLWKTEMHPVGENDYFRYKSSEAVPIVVPGDPQAAASALKEARAEIKGPPESNRFENPLFEN